VVAGKLKEKNMKKEKFFFVSLKSPKKGVGPGVGTGSIYQRYGSADPDPHQNVILMDFQHCFLVFYTLNFFLFRSSDM
jgi:hypothetical protein